MTERPLPGWRWAEAWIASLSRECDAGRWRRGATYFSDDRVLSLDVEPGLITATVQGSETYTVYNVEIGVPTLRPSAFLEKLQCRLDVQEGLGGDLETFPELIPDVGQVHFLCTCPDWGTPCKHAVAVWLTMATYIASRPRHLLELRGLVQGEEDDSVDGHGWAISDADDSDELDAFDWDDDALEAPGIDPVLFWEGDRAVWEPMCARLTEEPGTPSPPAWVFLPPVPWPDRKQSYTEVMREIYRRIREGASGI